MEEFTPEEARIKARSDAQLMRKPDLVRLALGLKLGPSRAALDVHHKGTLLRMVLDALRKQQQQQ